MVGRCIADGSLQNLHNLSLVYKALRQPAETFSRATSATGRKFPTNSSLLSGSLLFSSSSVEVIINTYNIYMGAPLRRLLRVIRASALNGFSSVPGSLERIPGERSFLSASFAVAKGC